ncbi:hypothetical protein BJX65DRAFT_7208 [Aspergillus insuetus]
MSIKLGRSAIQPLDCGRLRQPTRAATPRQWPVGAVLIQEQHDLEANRNHRPSVATWLRFLAVGLLVATSTVGCRTAGPGVSDPSRPMPRIWSLTFSGHCLRALNPNYLALRPSNLPRLRDNSHAGWLIPARVRAALMARLDRQEKPHSFRNAR